MQVLLTNESGTFDITQLVPSLRWSGNYRQAARSLEFSVLYSPTDGRAEPFKAVPAMAAAVMLWSCIRSIMRPPLISITILLSVPISVPSVAITCLLKRRFLANTLDILILSPCSVLCGIR